MRHILEFLALLLLFTSIACGQKPQEKPTLKSNVANDGYDIVTIVDSESVKNDIFISPKGKFSIAIPVMPTHTSDLATEKAKAKGIDVGKTFIWRYEDMFISIFYDPGVNIDGDASPLDFKDFEVGTRNGILNSKSTITAEREINSGVDKGREFRGVYFNGFNYISRILLKGDRGYQIVGAFVDKKDEQAVTNIIDSFKAPLK